MTTIALPRPRNALLDRMRTIQFGIGARGAVGVGLATQRGGAAASNGLLTDLVAYWSLDEASGDRSDSAGANTLTDINTVGSAAGKQSNAASFVAANMEALAINSNAALSMGDIGFTITCWANADTIGVYPEIVSKWQAAGTAREYRIIHYENQFQFWVSYNGATVGYVGTTGASAGNWYFVAAWHDPIANKIYISVDNGTPAEAPWSDGVGLNNSVFQLGAQPSYTGDLDAQWNGLIDEVGIWKRVLSSDDRTALYNAGAGLAYNEFTA